MSDEPKFIEAWVCDQPPTGGMNGMTEARRWHEHMMATDEQYRAAYAKTFAGAGEALSAEIRALFRPPLMRLALWLARLLNHVTGGPHMPPSERGDGHHRAGR